jgi:hypothetical protein
MTEVEAKKFSDGALSDIQSMSDATLKERLDWLKAPCGSDGLEVLAKLVAGPILLFVANERGMRVNV